MNKDIVKDNGADTFLDVNDKPTIHDLQARTEQIPLGFSKEEEEYFRELSEYKHAVDLQSRVVNAERRGERKGELIGRNKAQTEFARKLLRRNRPIDEIIEYTELTREEIEILDESAVCDLQAELDSEL